MLGDIKKRQKFVLIKGHSSWKLPKFTGESNLLLARIKFIVSGGDLDGDDFTFPKTGTPPEFPPVLRAKYTPQTNLNIENFDQRLYVDGYEEFWMMHES
ncbi:hypothetical protein RhiirA5_434074 [Rhizophagus irregularis]|uniref:Uncharacterized protein n=1 Tax=Rhizophagus irregularis TaxID=588596 RepID=A0A2N0NQN0_9GLOM|nr:hypothetical protein RhiirA5_434074 [Rhizophagus irregularis]